MLTLVIYTAYLVIAHLLKVWLLYLILDDGAHLSIDIAIHDLLSELGLKYHVYC